MKLSLPLIFLLLIVPVSAMHSITGNFLIDTNREEYEAMYGEDLVRVMEEAEVIWIRENKFTLYDYMGKQNYPVSHLTDDKINYILKNKKSRELAGIDIINITPYMDIARGINFEKDIVEKTIIRKTTVVEREEEVEESKTIKKTWGTYDEKKPEVEQPKIIVKKCVAKSPIKYNPLKINYWAVDLIFNKLGVRNNALNQNYC